MSFTSCCDGAEARRLAMQKQLLRSIKTIAVSLSFAFSVVIATTVRVQAEPTMAVVSAPDTSKYLLRPDATPAPSKPMYMEFVLKTASVDRIEAFLATQQDPTSPNYHHWISSAEFGRRFGASQADVNAVVAYAKSQGFTVTHAWDDNTFVSVKTDVAHAQAAFGVKINAYQRPASMIADGDPETFYAPDSQAKLPASIASRVDGVLGLDNFIIQHSDLSAQNAATKLTPVSSIGRAGGLNIGPLIGNVAPDFTGPIGPADLSKVYNIDGLKALGATGSGVKVGILSFSTRYTGDIQQFADNYGLGTISVSDVDIDGGPQDGNGADEESLDGEVVAGQAPKATIVFYDGDGNVDAARYDCLNQMQADGVQVVTSSQSSEEDLIIGLGAEGVTYYTNLQKIDAQLVAAGIPLYNSTGDNGALDKATDSHLEPHLECSEPDVTAVGGTSVYGDANGNWSSETAWTWSADTGGGGGGVSKIYKQPSYQTGPGVSNQYSDGNRQYPDIAALGDNSNPGYEIVINGAWSQVGGTSASTPLWASVNVLMTQLAGAKTGSLNTRLYNIGTNLNTAGEPFVYHDITVGSDGYYSATADWDFCSGWGSADFTKLYDDLYLKPNYLPYNPGSGGTLGTWTSPIMIHASTTSITEPATFTAGTSYQIGVAIADLGTADGLLSTNSLKIDGTTTPFTMGPYPAGYYLTYPNAFTVSFPAGTHTLTLTANTGNIAESNTTDNVYTRTITVTGGGTAALSSVTISPTSVTQGTSATGTVTLTAAAPTGGAAVTLSSNNAAVAAPALTSVTVPAGSTTANFNVNTGSVTTPTTVTISAVYSGVTKTATITVNPVVQTVGVASVTISPNPVAAGTNSAGTVTLTGAAPTGGAVVDLESDKPSDAVPSVTSITIPAGSTTGTFKIYTAKSLSASVTATITATYNSTSQSATITVNPATTAVSLVSVSASPNPVTVGTNATGTVTLSGAAPTGGIAVTLSSNKPTDAVPAVTSVTVPAGSTTATFKIYTAKSLTAPVTATLSAVYNGVTQTYNLTVNPATVAVSLVSVSASPNPVTSGSNATGTVTLSGAAPTGGIVVTLSSNKSSDAVPSTTTVTVPAGSTTANFTIYTAKNLTSPVTAIISAVYNGVTQTYSLTVNPLTTTVSLSSVSISPSTVTAGTNSTGTVTLSAAAPAGGIVVALSSNLPSDAVPAVTSVTVAAGSTSATFKIYTAKSLTRTITATISAVYNGVTKTATITVNPAATGPTLSSLSCNPSSIAPGGTTLFTITLTAAAPTGGASIPVTFGGSAYFTATIPAGSTSIAYFVTVSSSQALGGVVLAGTYNSSTAQTTLNVISEAWTLTSLTFDPDTINYGDAAVATITFSSTVTTATLVTFTDTNGYINNYYITPTGSSSYGVNFTSNFPDATYTDTVTAQANGISKSGNITVLQ